MRPWHRWAGLAGLAFLAACATTSIITRPTPAHVRRIQGQWPDVTLTDLEQGRRLYVQRCSGCHSLYRPEERLPTQWKGVLQEMSPRASLTAEQEQRVLQYLVSARTHQ